MRYFLTSAIIVGLFGTALYLRGAEPGPQGTDDAVVLTRHPEVRTEKVANGTELQVRYRFAGSCSRASVVYRHDGEDKILASTTNCRRQLGAPNSESNSEGDGLLDGDGYVNEVELTGILPHGASNVRLVLESETGTRIAPVEL